MLEYINPFLHFTLQHKSLGYGGIEIYLKKTDTTEFKLIQTVQLTLKCL